MNYNSPITEFVVEPFDVYSDSKKSLNCNNIALLQISFLLLSLSFYYFYQNMNNRSGMLYIIAYLIFYKFLKHVDNKDVKFISEISYFLINCIFILFVLSDKNYNNNSMVFMTLVIFLTFISFTLKFDNNVEFETQKLNDISSIFKIASNNIYPNDSKLKDYHIHKFWKIFDLSTLSFIIFLFLAN